MEVLQNRINGRLDAAEEKINNLECTAIESIKMKSREKKTILLRAAVACGAQAQLGARRGGEKWRDGKNT